ncbi:MAG: acyl carrier protein [Kangiellaceae bacterium]|nr:acyl carrier protein [Kangiellaceae bacterium]
MILTRLKSILSNVLEIDTSGFELSTQLLGNIPEFDSMAVMNLILAIEQNFQIEMRADELSAELFESLSSLSIHIKDQIVLLDSIEIA